MGGFKPAPAFDAPGYRQQFRGGDFRYGSAAYPRENIPFQQSGNLGAVGAGPDGNHFRQPFTGDHFEAVGGTFALRSFLRLALFAGINAACVSRHGAGGLPLIPRRDKRPLKGCCVCHQSGSPSSTSVRQWSEQRGTALFIGKPVSPGRRLCGANGGVSKRHDSNSLWQQAGYCQSYCQKGGIAIDQPGLLRTQKRPEPLMLLDVLAFNGLLWMGIWWVLTGSNRRHPACKASALPTELSTRLPITARYLAVKEACYSTTHLRFLPESNPDHWLFRHHALSARNKSVCAGTEIPGRVFLR